MGFVDRGGGRESKGGSLRRSKKNPGASAARKASAAKQPQHATRIPPTMPSFTDKEQHIDAAVAILARKLEVDRDVLMTRASQESGVAAILTWCADFDRQEALLDYCRQHNTTTTATSSTRTESSSGNMYCVVGVHVNNVDRMHKKVQQNWVDNVATWGKQPVVLGVLSGLNLERDGGTHFAQEWLLEQLWYTAGALQVPLVLHICHETSVNDDNDNDNDGIKGEGEGGNSSSSNGIGIGGTVEDCMTDSNPTVDRAADLLADLMSRKDDEDNVKDGDGSSQISTKKKPTAIVLYNGVGAVACSSAMRALLKRCVPSQDSTGITRDLMENTDTIVPIYVIATAEGLTDGKNNHDTTDKESTCISSCKSSFSMALRNHIALSQLLIGTGAPWNTPQNIPDEYMRTMPNEPANYRYVATAIHEVLTNGLPDHPLGIQQLYSTVRDNFLRVFFNTNTSKDQPQEEEEEVEEKEGKKEQKDEEEELISSVVVPSAPLPRVHFDPQISSTLNTVNSSGNSTRYFLCFKCRRRLFDEASLLTHQPDAARVNFGNRHNRKSAGSNTNQNKNNKNNNDNSRTNVGEACGSVWFVPVTEDMDGEWSVEGNGLVVERRSGTVRCGGCNAKIGSAGEFVCCPCGRTVSGLSARVAAYKVEAPVKCVDVSTTNAAGNGSETSTGISVHRGSGSGRQDLDELLAQAARERQQLQEEEEGEDEEEDGDGMGKKRRKQPKKNVKANNRSNFTHFRNKNFAPRHQTSGETVDDILSNRDNDSDESDDDNNNKQIEQFITKQQSSRRRKKQM